MITFIYIELFLCLVVVINLPHLCFEALDRRELNKQKNSKHNAAKCKEKKL